MSLRRPSSSESRRSGSPTSRSQRGSSRNAKLNGDAQSGRYDQKTGQEPPAGWGWREYLASLVEEHGTLTAVAWKLLERGDGPDDVASVERALRRLRERGQRDGGVWGQRLLRRFGVPRDIEARLRWMGLYHSPFNDLPLPLCEDQLRLWDQPPISSSRARVWLQLAAVSVALRRRAFDEARAHLDAAGATLRATESEGDRYAAARVEEALARGYLESRTGTSAEVDACLQSAERALDGAALDPADRACLVARLVDQKAFALNRRGDHSGALALYESLPADDLHPFASYRREAGLAFGCHRMGRIEEARAHAGRACDFAGDGGYTRLRVMALLMVARVEEGEKARGALLRAEGIARRLLDEELIMRVERQRKEKDGTNRPVAQGPARRT